jgi:DNA repair exonuclease SbcCD nuclease subunit
MRILHTADLHLAFNKPDTVKTLNKLLETAENKGVDILTIGGDIFDSPEDASRLRTEVRERCSNLSLDVVAIPGNHDADVFKQSFDLGTHLKVLRNDPYDKVECGEVTIIGVPFRSSLTSELFSTLQDAGGADNIRILLLHCTLDLGFGQSTASDEAESRYFPIELETLGRLNYEFVLAGHIHARFATEDLTNGGRFVYPGSPMAHSRAELGPRHAALIDTETGGIEPIELDTPYRDRRVFSVTPGNQETIPIELAEWVAGEDPDRASLEVTVEGYVDFDEKAYNDRLRKAAGLAALRSDVESATAVLEHEIYQGALDRLDDDVLAAHELATVDGVQKLLMSELAPLIHANEVR